MLALLLARDEGGGTQIDRYARVHKKWKQLVSKEWFKWRFHCHGTVVYEGRVCSKPAEGEEFEIPAEDLIGAGFATFYPLPKQHEKVVKTILA